MSLEIITIGVVVMVLNVLDSVTTALCFRQYPDKELKGEANPLARMLMLKSKVLAEVVKQGVLLALVIYYVLIGSIGTLRFLGILFGLVVVNNSYIVVSRAITKRKVVAPFKRLIDLLRISSKYIYIVIVAVLLGLAYVINIVVWG